MTPNLHRLTRAGAAALRLAVGPAALPASDPPCPPEAGELVAAGWRAYRADSIAVAADRFARADRLCPRNLDAKLGLGYAALRQDRPAAADSLFRIVLRADSTSTDAWDGLALTAWRRGDRPAALAAAQRSARLHPPGAAIRDLLDRLTPDWDRPALRRPVRPASLRVDARARGDFFEVPGGGGWRRFYVNGVNMGVALPGRFPSEFPRDSLTYAGWLDTLAAMHANTLRLYTILPPSFYRALRAWNLAHADRPLWLIHGVWTELPPRHEFNDAAWKGEFRQEMRRVVDLLHGHAEIPARQGHAGGRYDADLSRWTLAYIIGREWEPFAVKDFDARHPELARYAGRFLATTGRAPAMDVWMAEQCDYLLGYEVDRYNAIRPIAYTNWPTLDPLTHPTESNSAEEARWRRLVGRPTVSTPIEYENDAVSLDAMLVRATAANPAGWFASYHAYPYYPDFMLYDPGYDTTRSSEGRSNYFGYLTELKRHHAGLPLLLSEYGVPSSRGMAHQQPQGWSHGGHDEVAMARIDARLTREIRESGAAGGIIFAWMDEWFKKNWIVIDYEIPRENTRQWHNLMDAEQHYGILGFYAGDEAATPLPGGPVERWRALREVARQPSAAAGAPGGLRVGSDESYLYLAVEFAGMAGRPFPWNSADVAVALETWRPELGQTALPGGVTSEAGFEFLAAFRSPADADLRIAPEYNPYIGADRIVNGDDFGAFAHRPVTLARRTDGRFDSLFVITNRARFARDGRFFPAQGYNRGRLRHGTAGQSSLSDWYYDQAAGLLEVRLPWGLLNMSDPSTATLLFETVEDSVVGTRRADGLRLGVLLLHPGAGGPAVGAALPALGPGARWRTADLPRWEWPTWTTPRYHQRLKPVYDSLQALWTDP